MILMLIDHFQSIDLQKSFNATIQFVPNLGQGIMKSSCNVQGTTAAGHFNKLLEIAIPGEFLFCGEVPEEMKQAAIGMGLNATFAPNIFGFERALSN